MNLDQPSPARILPFVPRSGLTFGIYHGGVVESHHELSTGKPDSPDEINRALDRLQSDKHLIVRTYLRFTGTDADEFVQDLPGVAELARYTWNGRKLDLVLSNWDRTGNMGRWRNFIEHAVERYGPYVQNLQICEEPNHFEYPGDGRFGHSLEAVLSGVKAARTALRNRGLKCAVGFNAVPVSPMNDGFWPALCQRMTPAFLDALDYVGLNLYVDVAEPLVGKAEDAVERSLTEFRTISMAQAGIPANIPLHICESGWPTGPQRYYTRQADLLQSVVDKVYELRKSLNISQFELFSLRDADTANPDASHQFGILRDDYSPKPAFETYRQLIQQYGN
jgi:hypothetical protein